MVEGLCLALEGERAVVHAFAAAAAILVAGVQLAQDKRVLAADLLAHIPRIVVILILV